MSILDDSKDIANAADNELIGRHRDSIIDIYRDADKSADEHRYVMRKTAWTNNISYDDIPPTYSKLWHDDIASQRKIKQLEADLRHKSDLCNRLEEKERILLALIAWMKNELSDKISPDHIEGLNCVLSVRGLDEIDMQRVNSYIKRLNYEPTR